MVRSVRVDANPESVVATQGFDNLVSRRANRTQRGGNATRWVRY